MAIYTLWDTESARRLGEYTDIENALDVVRRDIARGKDYLWNSGALVQLTDDDADEHIVLFEDDMLIERARGTGGGMSPASEPPPVNTLAAPAPAVLDPGTTSRGAVARFGQEMAVYKPFGGVDFAKIFVGPSIRDLMGPSVNDLIPKIGEAFVPRVSSMPFASITNFDTSTLTGSLTTSDALVSFGRLDWNRFFAPNYESIAESFAQESVTSAFRASPSVLEDLSRLAGEVARYAATVGGLSDQIIALSQHPEARFVYHEVESDTEDAYVGAIAPEEPGDNITVLAWWRASKGKLVG